MSDNSFERSLAEIEGEIIEYKKRHPFNWPGFLMRRKANLQAVVDILRELANVR